MPIVWQLAVLQLTDNRALIKGVLLKRRPYTYGPKSSRLGNLAKVLGSYWVSPYADENIRIVYGEVEREIKTNEKGSFRLVLPYWAGDSIQIFQSTKELPLAVSQEYPISFPNTQKSYDVISDMDDTVVQSHTAHFFKRIGTLAFIAPQRRKVIGFTQQLLEIAVAQKAQVFYVSKSESNLFGVLATFISHNQLPKGLLFLTPYLSFWQLFQTKKGSTFKTGHIEFLIENRGANQYILLGDDSQQDMEIYGAIAQKYTNRILKIYIRLTQKNQGEAHERMRELLEGLNVPYTFFKTNDSLSEADIQLLRI